MSTEPEIVADLDQIIANLNRKLWRPTDAALAAFRADLTRIFPAWSDDQFHAVCGWVYRITARIKDLPRGTADDRLEAARRVESAITSVEVAVATLQALRPQEFELVGGMPGGGSHSGLELIVAATKFMELARLATTPESIDLAVNRYRDAMHGNSVQVTQFLPMLISIFEHYYGTPPIARTGKLIDFVSAAYRFAGWAEPSADSVKKAAGLYRQSPEVARKSAEVWGQGTPSLDLDT